MYTNNSNGHLSFETIRILAGLEVWKWTMYTCKQIIFGADDII